MTTKMRFLFNASEKSTSGKSLNDVQLKSPTIQRNIISFFNPFDSKIT